MKHVSYLIVGLLLCLCTSLSAKSKVINQPPFRVRNTTSIEVSKVVMSDTATVLHIYAKYLPKNWIQIAASSYLKDNNGETYQLRSGIGITPGKEFWMPDSGEAEFQLVFPPISANATSIDFAEAEGVEDAFCIWGIQLRGKKLPQLLLPKEAVIHPMEKNSTLQKPTISYGKATVKGRLLDYQLGMSKQLSLYPLEPIKGHSDAIKVEVELDGSFHTSFFVTGTTLVNAIFGESSILFFVEPEQSSEVFINLREVSRQQSKFQQTTKPNGAKVYINGPLALVAQEWNQSGIPTSLLSDFNEVSLKAADMDVQAFKVYLLEKQATIQQKIDKLPLSQATLELITLNNELSLLEAFSMAPKILTSTYMNQNPQKDEVAINDYYTKMRQSVPKDYIPATYYEKMNHPQAMLTIAYSTVIGLHIPNIATLTQLIGTDKGCLFDVLTTGKFYDGIKGFMPLTDEQKASLANLPTAYQTMLMQTNEELLHTIEANKGKENFIKNEAGEVGNEDLFTSILSKFRGKVLLVDFWATWCGPCRMANKMMAPMKEALKDKEIVYLYITSESSPLKTWENMISDLHGQHFRLTNDQWSYLCNSLKIEGVPTYFIIDPKGNTRFKQTGFPGVEKMESELLKVIPR